MDRVSTDDRYYMWLDDFESCWAGTYVIGDSLINCGPGCDGFCYSYEHEVADFPVGKDKDDDPEVEAKAVAYLKAKNEWWKDATKESVALDLVDTQEELETVRNQKKNTEHWLAEAWEFIVATIMANDLDREVRLAFWQLWQLWHYTERYLPQESRDEINKLLLDWKASRELGKEPAMWDQRLQQLRARRVNDLT